MDFSNILSLIVSSYRDLTEDGSGDLPRLTWGKLLRSILAAAAMLPGIWLLTAELDRGAETPVATLLATFLCTPAALLLGYPLGGIGAAVGTGLATRFSLGLPRWIAIGGGIIVVGLIVGGLGALLLFAVAPILK